MRATERQRLVVELLGVIVIVVALAMIHLPLAVLASGVALVLAANFYLQRADKEPGNADSREHDQPDQAERR